MSISLVSAALSSLRWHENSAHFRGFPQSFSFSISLPLVCY